MDLDEWVRGERDWRSLFEFFGRLADRMGSACWSQRIQDPEVVAELAAQPKSAEPSAPPIEGFGWHEATLLKILDRLTQIAFGTVQADPSAAPSEPWPEYPHLAAREAIRRAPLLDVVSQLIPEGGE